MLIKGYSQVNMENLVKMLKKHVIAVKSDLLWKLLLRQSNPQLPLSAGTSVSEGYKMLAEGHEFENQEIFFQKNKLIHVTNCKHASFVFLVKKMDILKQQSVEICLFSQPQVATGGTAVIDFFFFSSGVQHLVERVHGHHTSHDQTS